MRIAAATALLLSCVIARAATHPASTASRADVLSAYNICSDGDTVTIPAGSATWSSSIDVSAKAVSFIGAGSNSTIITGQNLFDCQIQNNHHSPFFWRVSGIKSVRSEWTPGSYTLHFVTSTANTNDPLYLRVDHCFFEKGYSAVTIDGCNVFGVIDHNTFNDTQIGVQPLGGSYIWPPNGYPITAGTTNAMVIEDNHFVVRTDNGNGQESITSGHGVRYVLRHNDFDGDNYLTGSYNATENHGKGGATANPPSTTDLRGPPILEIYQNNFHAHDLAYMSKIRGGSLLVWSNTITDGAGNPGDPPYILTEDQTTGDTSYAGVDQIQNTFIWGNYANGTLITTNRWTDYTFDHNYIQLNRNYFFHAPDATSGIITWSDWPGSHNATFTAGVPNAYYPYTPLVYPHPLVTLLDGPFTYYVSTSGNDSNDGLTSGTAWRTIQKAANTVRAGDTVNVASGSYGETVTFTNSGTSGNPITFLGTSASTSAATVSSDYTTIKGFAWTSIGNPEIQWNGNNGYLSDCTFNAATTKCIDWEGNNGVMTNLDFGGSLANNIVCISTGGDTISILNSTFHDKDNCDAFIFPWGKNITIRGLLMTNCDNTGYTSLGIHADFVQTFAYNSTRDAWSSNVVVENCRVLNCNVQAFMLNSANVGVNESTNMRNWIIRNNVFANSGQSAFVHQPYVSIFNNVFYKWGLSNAFPFQSQDRVTDYGSGTNCVVTNNVFLACNNTEASTWGVPDLQASFNFHDYNYVGGIGFAAKANNSTWTLDAHGINGGDPKFVNTALNVLDFHQQSGSPLKDAGVTIASFSTDLEGTSRPQGAAWDIGAYEFTASSSAPPSSITIFPGVRFGSGVAVR